jgi:predicted cupin superfamily sugar epimerase
VSSAILFLVTGDRPSRFHRLASDELWLYHGGSRLELVTLLPDGRGQSTMLAGAGLLVRDEELTPQATVPGDAWQAARVAPGEGVDWTLVSCVVTPGFDFDDFELADPAELRSAYPDQADVVAALS